MRKGIDISTYQKGVDYKSLKNDIDFVILQSSYGRNSIDDMFMEHVSGCNKNGIKIDAVYHFMYCINNQEALLNAQNCIRRVQEANLPKTTMIFCDLEGDTLDKAKSRGVTLGNSEINLFTETFCKHISDQGYKVGIYTNNDFYQNKYKKELLAKYPIWLADLSGQPDHDCLYHQYSWKGSVHGISGVVDMNYHYGDKSVSASSQSVTTASKTNTIPLELPTIKFGSSGDLVRVLQALLVGLTVDGSFGKNTQARVKQYQIANGLKSDGIVGKETWTCLFKKAVTHV